MNGAHQGRRHEWRWRDHFESEGYEVVRAAASRGAADLICIKPGQVLLVQCKRTALPSPAERRELVRVARLLPGVALPIIARGKRLLLVTDDGTDPRACVEWTPDEVAR